MAKSDRIVGIVVCVIITLLALESGEIFMIAIFGGLSAFLIYREATRKKRIENQNERRRQRAAAELRARANRRFGNSNFAKMVVRDLQLSNWAELDDAKGVKVLFKEIITSSRQYRYIDYGLAPLKVDGTKELADYISSFYHGDDLYVSEIIKISGGFTGGYSGFVGSDGSVSLSRDVSGGEYVEGYQILRKRPKKQPQGVKW